MGKMVVLTPDDEILIKEYNSYSDTREVVNGYCETVLVPSWISEIFTKAKDPEIRNTICHYLCNESGYYTSTGYEERANAMVSMMYDAGPIFGAVAVVKLEDVPVIEDGSIIYTEPDDVGFSYKEAKFLKETLENIFSDQKIALAKIHEAYDDVKRELSPHLFKDDTEEER